MSQILVTKSWSISIDFRTLVVFFFETLIIYDILCTESKAKKAVYGMDNIKLTGINDEIFIWNFIVTKFILHYWLFNNAYCWSVWLKLKFT